MILLMSLLVLSAQKRPSAVLWSRACAPSLNAVNPIYIAPASREKPALLYVLARFVRVIRACDVCMYGCDGGWLLVCGFVCNFPGLTIDDDMICAPCCVYFV